MVFGVKCTKDSIHIAVLDGSVEEPSSSEDRVKITIKASKAQKVRGGALADMMKEFGELLLKYGPCRVCMKRAGTTQGGKSQIPRGEVEGVIHMACYHEGIDIDSFVNATIKARLGLSSASTSNLRAAVNEEFDEYKLNNDHRDAILAGWAILDG